MNKVISFIRSKLIDIKIYISRTMSWVSMANSLMLVFLVIERLSSLGVIKGDLGKSLIFVIIAWFILLVFLGWLEIKKIQAPQIESIKLLEFNLPIKYIITKVDEIDEKIKKIERDLKKFKLKWH